jgi:hypothetical protein
VIWHTCRGRDDVLIARVLEISQETVRRTRKGAMRKLRARYPQYEKRGPSESFWAAILACQSNRRLPDPGSAPPVQQATSSDRIAARAFGTCPEDFAGRVPRGTPIWDSWGRPTGLVDLADEERTRPGASDAPFLLAMAQDVRQAVAAIA